MQLQALEPLFKIFYTFLFLPTKISREKLQTNIWKIESKGLVKFKHKSTKFVSKILCCVALVYLLFYFILFIIIFFFFSTGVLRKLCDIRCSYKHCKFSRGWLLVKMASKTAIRPFRRPVGVVIPCCEDRQFTFS